jgi:hypothetical protein
MASVRRRAGRGKHPATCVTWQASAARATWRRYKRNMGDVTSATWATSPPFHLYSCTWDWYPGRGRTPEKRGDVSDVKRGPATCPLLLPNHWNRPGTSHCSKMVSESGILCRRKFGRQSRPQFRRRKDYFIEKKKYNFFSRSNFTRGKGRVSGFFGHEDAEFFFTSAAGGLHEWKKTRHRVTKKVTHKAPSTSEIRKVKKCTFFF